MSRRFGRHVTLVVAIVVVASLFLTGCPTEEDDSVSINERIDSFMDDVNAGRFGSLQKHIHPDASQYQQSAAESTWTPGTFKSSVTYTLGQKTRVDSVVTAPLTSSDDLYDGITATFTMEEHGSDIWKIRRLEFGNFTLQSVD
jgi:hypothetical protein